MTASDYSEAIDYLLYICESDIITRYEALSVSPSRYSYQMLLTKIREVDVLFEIANALGFGNYMKNQHQPLIRQIDKCAKMFGSCFSVRESTLKSESSSVSIGEMYDDYDDIAIPALVKWLNQLKSGDHIHVDYVAIGIPMFMQLGGLWWNDWTINDDIIYEMFVTVLGVVTEEEWING